MARPRKPVSLQTGHIVQSDRARMEAEEEIIKADGKQLKTPPKWLNKDAKKEWKRIVKAQSDLNTLCDLDYNALSRYCTMVVAVRKVEEIINRDIGPPTEGLLAAADYLRKTSPELTRLENRLHMSASERLKFASEKLEQQEKKIENQFGAI